MAELIDIGYLASPEAIGAAVTTTTTKAAVATTKAAEAAASAAAAQAVGTTNDTVIAGRINDPASATATALTATILDLAGPALVEKTTRPGVFDIAAPDRITESPTRPGVFLIGVVA